MTLQTGLLRGERIYLAAVEEADMETISRWTQVSDYLRLYDSLGFVREGVYREHLQRDGQRYDMILYGILRHEWQTRGRLAAA